VLLRTAEPPERLIQADHVEGIEAESVQARRQRFRLEPPASVTGRLTLGPWLVQGAEEGLKAPRAGGEGSKGKVPSVLVPFGAPFPFRERTWR